MLAAEGFSFFRGLRAVLDRVSFEVRSGERFAILGPNGAGKSTLLKCLCRIWTGGTGRLLLEGRPLEAFSQKTLARQLAYVPQAGRREDLFTVGEFVLMGRYPHLSPFSTLTARDRRAAQEAMERTGVADWARRRVGTLSGGEQQKVLIAAAVAQQARIMLLDEPTAFLDPYQQDQVETLLTALHAELGLTLIEVTHDVNRAALRHQRVLALREGRVVFVGTPADLMRVETLETVYGKRFELGPHPRTGRLMVLPEAA